MQMWKALTELIDGFFDSVNAVISPKDVSSASFDPTNADIGTGAQVDPSAIEMLKGFVIRAQPTPLTQLLPPAVQRSISRPRAGIRLAESEWAAKQLFAK
jgi:hypothetical protein